jgi:hypothetical protein
LAKPCIKRVEAYGSMASALFANDKNVVGIKEGSRAVLAEEGLLCVFVWLPTSQTFEGPLLLHFHPPPLNYS